MNPLRIVVVGTVASNPYAGMAWMHLQVVVGLQRLGHDVFYFETTSAWPFDPEKNARVCESTYALDYLSRVADRFGLGARWAYRRSYLDKAWFGMTRTVAEEILATADLVFNITGATRFGEEDLKTGHLVYVGTDPVVHEIAYAHGDEEAKVIVEEHDDLVTYGENIGTSASPIPPLPGLRAHTRQPVLMDFWDCGPPSREEFTTVANWKQDGRDIRFAGETYRWSKHHEFLKFITIPEQVSLPVELAMNLADPSTIQHGEGERVRTLGVEGDARSLLEANGWRLKEARGFTTDPWAYRDYLVTSRGEFTVARDLNVRLRSGWFSERSACYLAAGRPVITQDTGFGRVLPTGEGLFSFSTEEEVLQAFDSVASGYERHSRAAREIAEEFFKAERVLSSLLVALGC